MIQDGQIQQRFFHQLKGYIPPHLSLVDELAELLDVSHDSVYRRIRGEKPISLTELKLICDHYRVSVDTLLQLSSNAVVFYKPPQQEQSDDFGNYLNGILKQMCYFNSFHHKTMFYLCKDIPVFYFFIFPEIAAFKTFFWMKSVLNRSTFAHVPFSLHDHHFEDCFAIGQQIIQEYHKIPSVEIWNPESFDSTLSQVEYYRDTGGFKTAADLKAVVASLVRVLDYLEMQAAQGRKLSAKAGTSPPVKIELYINEIIIGSNTILLELDGNKMSILTYSVLKYLITKDEILCTETFETFENLKNRSVLISQTGEKERLKFFNALKQRVNALSG